MTRETSKAISSAILGSIPDGMPKSGRVWKAKQTSRTSTQKRQGVLSHLQSTLEKRRKEKQDRDKVKALERAMKEETIAKREDEKTQREERQKRRMENEFKSSKYQNINAEKMKTMNKKQLRMIKKTRMNKNGVVELVDAYAK
jgi:hypothetical protein